MVPMEPIEAVADGTVYELEASESDPDFPQGECIQTLEETGAYGPDSKPLSADPL